jgi:hypothetical protein
MLAASWNHVCHIQADTTVACWGANHDGQLGIGSVAARVTAPQIVPGLTGVVEIAPGPTHTCARTSVGSVYCWGDNKAGQCGNQFHDKLITPSKVLNLGNATSLAVGRYHSCAKDKDGATLCWGKSSTETSPQPRAFDVDPGAAEPPTERDKFGALVASARAEHKTVVLGHQLVCALDDVGAVLCAGDNRAGGLGDGTMNPRWELAPVKPPVPVPASAIAPKPTWQNKATLELCGPDKAGRKAPISSGPALLPKPGDSCGNNQLDEIGSECPPCIPGRRCDCQPILETCDGTNLGGSSCQMHGYGGVTLACKSCQFDTSGCTACVNSAQVSCVSVGSITPLRIARDAAGKHLALLGQRSRSTCLEAVFQALDQDGAPVGAAVGVGSSIKPGEIVGVDGGWLTALYQNDTTTIVPLDRLGRPSPATATLTRARPAFMTRTETGVLLGARDSSDNLYVAVIDSSGKPVGEPQLALAGTRPNPTFRDRPPLVVVSGDRTIIARGQSVPTLPFAIAVAVVAEDGTVLVRRILRELGRMPRWPAGAFVTGDTVSILLHAEFAKRIITSGVSWIEVNRSGQLVGKPTETVRTDAYAIRMATDGAGAGTVVLGSGGQIVASDVSTPLAAPKKQIPVAASPNLFIEDIEAVPGGALVIGTGRMGRWLARVKVR